MPATVSIKDVARVAGVSATTVSHALNGKGRLPEITRAHVRRVAAELGYRPNPTARHLAGGTTGLIGLSLSHVPGHPVGLADFAYFMQLFGAATAAAIEHGFALVLASAPSGGSGAQEPILDTVALDGAIVVDPVVDDPVVRRLREREVPVVTTGRVPGEPRDSGLWVDNDHGHATRSALGHLRHAGATRVGVLTSPPVTTYVTDTLEAYHAWCDAAGSTARIAEAPGEPTELAGVAAAATLLDSPDPPDALYCTLDRLAVGVLLAAQTRGLSVPGDLLVIACTDSEASLRTRPALSAVHLHPELIGRSAVDLLLQQIRGEVHNPRRIIATRIRRRASSRRPVPAAAPSRDHPPRRTSRPSEAG